MVSERLRSELRPLLIPLLILSVAIGLVAAATAQARTTYGPWFEQGRDMQVQSEPFNSRSVAEQSNFACVLENGETLNDDQEYILSTIFQDAAKVYNGTYQIKVEVDDGDLPPSVYQRISNGNSGYDTRESGMREFLQIQKQLVQHRGWTPIDNQEFGKNQDQTGNEWASWYQLHGAQIDIDEEAKEEEGYSDMQEHPTQITRYINYEANNPLQLTSLLPEGCNLNGLLPDEPGDIGDFLGDPIQWLTEAVFYIPRKMAGEAAQPLLPVGRSVLLLHRPHRARRSDVEPDPDLLAIRRQRPVLRPGLRQLRHRLTVSRQHPAGLRQA